MGIHKTNARVRNTNHMRAEGLLEVTSYNSPLTCQTVTAAAEHRYHVYTVYTYEI